MYKSGLIAGGLTLLIAIGATLLSPLCTPCLVVFLGAGAGYLAGVFDKPITKNASTKAGVIGGAVGGVGAIIGQMIGAGLNAFIMGPQGAQQFNENFGLPSGGAGFEQGYWFGLVGSAVCVSLIDILLMAGFGALGGLLWWQMTGKNANAVIASENKA